MYFAEVYTFIALQYHPLNHSPSTRKGKFKTLFQISKVAGRKLCLKLLPISNYLFKKFNK